ncbi:membrane-associated protein [Streptacidiphilus sp. MAP12-16]|jgi:membrane-associated protein|uniref:DedA family protein n=1 Tax=Streptacidiphilus sp. MAP12-16 TaxID=3156300 RepID=UPI003513BF54
MIPTGLVAAAGPWSYLVVFALIAGETSAFIGVIFPGETLVLLAAALAGRGVLDPVLLAGTVVGAAIAGDTIGFALGHWFEQRSGADRPRPRPRAGRGVGRARDLLRRRGGAAVFIGRFIGFVRSFVPFTAGAVGMRYRRFLPYSASAALVWGVGNVLAGYFLGSSAERLVRAAGIAGAAVAAAVAVAVFLLLRHRRGTANGRPGRHMSTPRPNPSSLEPAAPEPEAVRS